MILYILSKFMHAQQSTNTIIHYIHYIILLGFDFRAFHLLSRWSTTWATPSFLFAFLGYFSDKVSLFAWSLPQTRLSYPGLLHNWDYRYESPYWLAGWYEVLLIFLPRLAWSYDFPDLYLLSSCDCRHEAPWLAKSSLK